MKTALFSLALIAAWSASTPAGASGTFILSCDSVDRHGAPHPVTTITVTLASGSYGLTYETCKEMTNWGCATDDRTESLYLLEPNPDEKDKFRFVGTPDATLEAHASTVDIHWGPGKDESFDRKLCVIAH